MHSLISYCGRIWKSLGSILIALALVACSGRTLFEGCIESSETLHPALAVPVLLIGCTTAAAVDQVYHEVLEPFVSTPVSIGSQLWSQATKGTEPGDFLVHGNWCGPGNPPIGSDDPPAIDALDKACKRHDLCYEDLGYYSCKCDVQFVQEIRENRDLPNELQFKAQTISKYFDGSFCEGCKQTKRGNRVGWVCHRPTEFGCQMEPPSLTQQYASCP